MSTRGFFQKTMDAMESFPSFEFSDDPRVSKRGYEHLFKEVRGNQIDGVIARDPKEVEVPSPNGDAKETKLLLVIETSDKTKGFVSFPKKHPLHNNGMKVPFDSSNPDHKLVLLWVPAMGNMPSVILDASGGELGKGQRIRLWLDGLKDTGKANLARQFGAEIGAMPVRVSGGVSAADLDED